MSSAPAMPLSLATSPAEYVARFREAADHDARKQQLRRDTEALEELFRAAFAQSSGSASSDVAEAQRILRTEKHPLMIPVHDFSEDVRLHPSLTPSERSQPVVFELDKDEREAAGKPAIVDEASFLRNWDIFTEGCFRNMNWDNVFAAGGSVLACLMPIPEKYDTRNLERRKYFHEVGYPASDIDLFIYGLGEEQARQKLVEIFNCVADNVPYEVIAFRSSLAISFVSKYPHRHVQVVLRIYQSPAEVLMGFDVDSCSVGFDGKKAYVLPRSHYAILHQRNTVSLTRRSTTYETRLAKYADRGFEVVVPFLDRNRIDPIIFERSFIKAPPGLARLLVLELMKRPEDRLKYRELVRARRLRPALPSKNQFTRHFRKKDHSEWDRARVRELNADASDYSTVFLPWGPTWAAKDVAKIMNRKDYVINSDFYDLDKTVHTHPCFFGDINKVLNDCCGHCPPDPERDAKSPVDFPYVYGPLKWIVDEPGRQQIGSFHPLTDADYCEGAYFSKEREEVCLAIMKDDVATVKRLLDEGKVKASDCDHTGRSLLHLAALVGASAIARLLLDHGCLLKVHMADGRTPLHVAAEYGFADIIRMIIKKSQENKRDREAREAGVQARRSARMDDMDDMDDEGYEGEEDDEDADDGNDMDVDGKKAAAAAAAAPAPAQKTDGNPEFRVAGQEALAAASAGRHRATGTIKDRAEERRRKKEKAEKEAEGGEEGDLDDEEEKLKEIDINIVDWDQQMTPLHYAVLYGQLDALKELLLLGANADLPVKIEIPDPYGYGHNNTYRSFTVLQLVMISEACDLDLKRQIATVLIENGARVTTLNLNLESVILIACREGHIDMLKLFFELDPLSQKALNGIYKRKTPLIEALRNGRTEVIDFLLQHGVELTPSPETIAYASAFEGQVRTMRLPGVNVPYGEIPASSLDSLQVAYELCKEYSTTDADVNARNEAVLRKLLSIAPAGHLNQSTTVKTARESRYFFFHGAGQPFGGFGQTFGGYQKVNLKQVDPDGIVPIKITLMDRLQDEILALEEKLQETRDEWRITKDTEQMQKSATAAEAEANKKREEMLIERMRTLLKEAPAGTYAHRVLRFYIAKRATFITGLKQLVPNTRQLLPAIEGVNAMEIDGQNADNSKKGDKNGENDDEDEDEGDGDVAYLGLKGDFDIDLDDDRLLAFVGADDEEDDERMGSRRELQPYNFYSTETYFHEHNSPQEKINFLKQKLASGGSTMSELKKKRIRNTIYLLKRRLQLLKKKREEEAAKAVPPQELQIKQLEEKLAHLHKLKSILADEFGCKPYAELANDEELAAIRSFKDWEMREKAARDVKTANERENRRAAVASQYALRQKTLNTNNPLAGTLHVSMAAAVNSGGNFADSHLLPGGDAQWTVTLVPTEPRKPIFEVTLHELVLFQSEIRFIDYQLESQRVQKNTVSCINEDYKRSFALFEAVWNNDIDTVRRLTSASLGADRAFVCKYDHSLHSPIGLAALRGHHELFFELIRIALDQYKPKPKIEEIKKDAAAAAETNKPPRINNFDLLQDSWKNAASFVADLRADRRIDPDDPNAVEVKVDSNNAQLNYDIGSTLLHHGHVMPHEFTLHEKLAPSVLKDMPELHAVNNAWWKIAAIKDLDFFKRFVEFTRVHTFLDNEHKEKKLFDLIIPQIAGEVYDLALRLDRVDTLEYILSVAAGHINFEHAILMGYLSARAGTKRRPLTVRENFAQEKRIKKLLKYSEEEAKRYGEMRDRYDNDDDDEDEEEEAEEAEQTIEEDEKGDDDDEDEDDESNSAKRPERYRGLLSEERVVVNKLVRNQWHRGHPLVQAVQLNAKKTFDFLLSKDILRPLEAFAATSKKFQKTLAKLPNIQSDLLHGAILAEIVSEIMHPSKAWWIAQFWQKVREFYSPSREIQFEIINRRSTGDLCTILHRAVHQENGVEKIRLLLENGADLTIRNDNNGHTPLHLAARQGKVEMVEELCKHLTPSNVNLLFKRTPLHQHTPIMLASLGNSAKHTATVKVLLRAHSTVRQSSSSSSSSSSSKVDADGQLIVAPASGIRIPIDELRETDRELETILNISLRHCNTETLELIINAAGGPDGAHALLEELLTQENAVGMNAVDVCHLYYRRLMLNLDANNKQSSTALDAILRLVHIYIEHRHRRHGADAFTAGMQEAKIGSEPLCLPSTVATTQKEFEKGNPRIARPKKEDVSDMQKKPPPASLHLMQMVTELVRRRKSSPFTPAVKATNLVLDNLHQFSKENVMGGDYRSY